MPVEKVETVLEGFSRVEESRVFEQGEVDLTVMPIDVQEGSEGLQITLYIGVGLLNNHFYLGFNVFLWGLFQPILHLQIVTFRRLPVATHCVIPLFQHIHIHCHFLMSTPPFETH